VRTAEEFANEQIIPAADRADECREFNSDLQDTFLETGLPREFLDPQPGEEFATVAASITEALAYGCAAHASYLMLPLFFNRVVIGSLPPSESEAFKEECLRRPVVTAFAATERESGSDLLAMSVKGRAPRRRLQALRPQGIQLKPGPGRRSSAGGRPDIRRRAREELPYMVPGADRFTRRGGR
jgi:alkylation response protein AidB-like acyl-CoA dehydrogenase